MNVAVARSPWRLLVWVLVAVPMVLLAVDMTIAHRFFPKPDATDVVVSEVTLADGSVSQVTEEQLTLDGKAQRRRDLLWGSVLFAAGGAIIAWSIKDLLLPRTVLSADDEGITVRVGASTRQVLRLPWPEVAEVRYGEIEDAGGSAPVLSLRLHDGGLIPARVWGGKADPPWLHLYAEEWDNPAHQVAPILDLRLARAPRTDPED